MLLFILPVQAQRVAVSQGIKLSSRTPKFRILGRNQDGIVVHRYGGTSNYIDVYDNKLRLRVNESQIDLKRASAQIEQVILSTRGAYAISTVYSKGVLAVVGNVLDAKYVPAANITGLDTVEVEKQQSYLEPRYRVSQDGSAHLFYFPIQENGVLSAVRLISMNEVFKVNHRQTIRFAELGREPKLDGAVITNDGDVYLLLATSNKEEAELGHTELHAYRLSAKSTIVQDQRIKLDERAFGDAFMTFDNLNKELIVSGFYTETDRKIEKSSNGFYFLRLDPYDLRQKDQSAIAYNGDFMYQLTGKEKSREEKTLFTFKIRDLILRADGGAVIVAESFYKDSEEVRMVGGMMNTGFNDYKVINVYHYNDMVVFSVSPQNKVDWASILRKRQLSENDNGAFSSFSLFNDRASLKLIYMEEIFSRAPINLYSVFPDGTFDRDMLLKQEDNDLMLIPKLGVQTGPSELVIPSFKKNNLKIVRVNF